LNDCASLTRSTTVGIASAMIAGVVGLRLRRPWRRCVALHVDAVLGGDGQSEIWEAVDAARDAAASSASAPGGGPGGSPGPEVRLRPSGQGAVRRAQWGWSLFSRRARRRRRRRAHVPVAAPWSLIPLGALVPAPARC
jgi:hypothetical protein